MRPFTLREHGGALNMFASFAFVITLLVPVFGSQIEVTVKSSTQDGCWKARRAAQTMLRDVKAHVTECEEIKREGS